MNKKILISAILIVVIAVVSINFSLIKEEFIEQFITAEMFVDADIDQFDAGPNIGLKIPPINAIYDGKIILDITTFSGESGLVLVINRSLDWCPFCMKQTIQLQEYKKKFEAAGINVVIITYDKPILQNEFAKKHSIDLPLLSDIKAQTFKSISVLRNDFKPGDKQYGLPYPGMLVIDATGVIRGKLFIEDYSSRVDSKAVLAYAESKLSN
jgi:peroxiredoxin